MRGTFARGVRIVSAFLLGLCAGAWLVVPFFATRLRQAGLELEATRQELEQARARAESLSQAEPAQLTVREVDCLVLCPDAEVRLGITRQCGELTRHLLGRPLRQLDPYLLHNLLHGRKVRVGDQDYVLFVDAVLASEKVAYYIRASPAPPH